MSTEQRQPSASSPARKTLLLQYVRTPPIRYRLTHPEFARRIGMNGREHVRENFLITRDVKRWLLLFRTLCGQPTGVRYDGRGNRIDNFFTELRS